MSQATARSPESITAVFDDLDRRLDAMDGRLESLHQTLARESPLDPLTALPAAAAFLRALENEWHRAARLGLIADLFVIDVEALAAVNDEFGRQAADRVLAALAAFLRQNTRQYDILGRPDGDTFALLTVHRPTEAYDPAPHADRLRRTFLARPIEIGLGTPIHVTLAIGIATTRPGADGARKPADLLQEALQDLSRRSPGC